MASSTGITSRGAGKGVVNIEDTDRNGYVVAKLHSDRGIGRDDHHATTAK